MADRPINLSPSKARKARQAIDFLSSLSLPGPSTATDTNYSSSPGPNPNSGGGFGTKKIGRIEKATNMAITALGRMRDGVGRKRVKEEVSSLYRSKQPSKSVPWRHKFFCLASKDQTRSPTIESEKEELFRAGLGEKELIFEDVNMCQQDFHELILEAFPRLKEGGGFRFLKGVPNSRHMEVLSMGVHKSPYILKQRVGTSRTYVRPLQKDLDLTPLNDSDNEPSEECLTCGQLLSLDKLEEHIQGCGRQAKKIKKEKAEIDLTHDSDYEDNELPSFMDLYLPKPIIGSDDDPALQAAINESITTSREKSDKETITSVGAAIQSMCMPPSGNAVIIEVRRNFILVDALKESKKAKFNPSHPLKVKFVGEGAVDCGGPRREFFRILAIDAQQKYFTGLENRKYFACDVSALQRKDFLSLGVYVGMSIIQGGSGFPFLSEPVYCYLCTGKSTDITVPTGDIPDPTLQFVCEKIDDARDEDELRVIFEIEEAQSLLLETGFRKAVVKLTMSDKLALKSALLDYHCMVKVKAQMDQFAEGLDTLSVLRLIKRFPELCKPLFVANNKPISSDELKQLVLLQFSEKGSNKRPKEEQTWIYFGDFLDECEEGKVPCTVENVLVFFSGASCVPPLGFPRQPQVVFRDEILCTSSTCDLTLRLPTKHEDYVSFQESMLLSLKGNDGFGGV